MENRKIETRKATCKKCETQQLWTLDGKYPNGIKKWRDESGLTCNGRVCGSCNRSRVKDTMRKGRASKKEIVEQAS